MRIRRASTVTFLLAVRILRVFLSFVANILIARSVGPDGVGYVNYILLIVTCLGSYGTLGVTNASSYYLKQSKWDEEKVANTNITVVFVSALLIAIVLLILRFLGMILIGYNIIIIAYCCFLVFFQLSANFFSTVFIAENRVNTLVLMQFLALLIRIILLFIFLKTGELGRDLIILFIVVEWGALSITLFFLSPLKFRVAFSKDILFSEIKYGINGLVSGLLMFLNYRFSYILIRNNYGNEVLGVFSIATQLAELVFIIPTTFEPILSAFLLGEKKGKRENTQNTIRTVLSLCILCSIIGAILSPLIPILFGSHFNTSIPVFLILLPGVILASAAKIAATFFLNIGKPFIHLVVTFTMFVINLALCILLIPHQGAIGAAIASTIVYSVYFVMYLPFLYKEGFCLKDALIPHPGDIMSGLGIRR